MMMPKKTIKQIEKKKPITITRLIKCYVCHQNLQSQALFDAHIKQHQNKLNRNTMEQLQRKTQESFKAKKHVSPLNRTSINQFNLNNPNLDPTTSQQVLSLTKSQQDQEEKEEQLVEQALRQSQILLEKIEFMTQINHNANVSQHPKIKERYVEHEPQIVAQKLSEKELYFKLSQSLRMNIEDLILRTQFDTKYFENYQQQLSHLRQLSKFAVSTVSITKITQIRQKICEDICEQLKKYYDERKQMSSRVKEECGQNKVKIEENTEVRNCGECYGSIECNTDFYQLDCGHNYHLDCWSEKQKCCY